MTALTERLVFGTARLAGGPYAARSRRMIEACIGADITRFDTAPGYGMGASEALLGEVTAGQNDIALHTKVGSLRPSAPDLRGWAKWVRNLAPNAAAAHRLDGAIESFTQVPPGMTFSAEAVAGSLARSHDLLQREQIDLVLLHEAEPQLIDQSAWNTLCAAAAQGAIGRLGFAHYGPPQHSDPLLIAQTAPQAADFLRGTPGQPRIFHSIRRALRAAMRQDTAITKAAEQLTVQFGLSPDNGAHEYLVGLLLLARHWPDAALIFATSRPENLAGFVGLIARVEDW